MMKLCIIGSRGHIGYVFRTLSMVPEVELCAVCGGGDAPDKLLDLVAKFNSGTPEVYDDWRVMLDEVKPEIVAVDGPFELHAEMAVYALERGIHVCCEKPIALNITDLERIATARQRSGAHIISMVGLRYAPPFQHALKLVRSGAVGKVKLIRAQKSYKLGERPDFYRHHESYGGTIPWVGSHALDWMLAFSGSEAAQMWATQTTSDNRGHGDLESVCQCMLVMKNGIQCCATLDYLRPGAAPTHGDDRLYVAGTDGVIEIRGGKIFLTDASGFREVAVPPAEREMFPDFVHAVSGRGTALVSDDETLELTRMCLRVRDCAVQI